MAMAAIRKSATAAISLIKATAAVKFPHSRSSNLETPNFLGSIRSMSQIYSRQNRSAPFGFNPVHNSVWAPAGTRSATNVSSPLSTQKLRLFHGAPKEVMNMAEKRNIQDYKRRLLAQKYEMRRKLYKAFCSDPSLPMDLREKCRAKLSKLPRNSSFTRIRNRCIFTGRPRSVYRVFRTSRIVFRDLASKGELMGVKKASW